eukprot:jgi/Mesvir1/3519/Mv11995-RA.1
MAPTPVRFIAAGNMQNGRFQRVKKACETLNASVPSFQCEIKSMVPMDYDIYLTEVMKVAVDAPRRHKNQVLILEGTHDTRLVYFGGELLQSSEQDLAFMRYLQQTFQYDDSKTNTAIYQRLGHLQWSALLNNSKNAYVFMDITISGVWEGRLTIELFSDAAPKTCLNFFRLIQGFPKEGGGPALSYLNTPIHRVVKGGWIQGGDIVKGDGDQGVSIYGPTFADETFQFSHDKPGMLGMANHGPHTNGSQFYITLHPLPWLDKKRVVFGRVVSGMRVLRLVEEAPSVNERPTDTVISSCGVLSPGGFATK